MILMVRYFAPAWIGFGHSFAMKDESDQAMAAYRSVSVSARQFPSVSVRMCPSVSVVSRQSRDVVFSFLFFSTFFVSFLLSFLTNKEQRNQPKSHLNTVFLAHTYIFVSFFFLSFLFFLCFWVFFREETVSISREANDCHREII